MDSEPTHEGACLCGQTSWRIVGKPILSAYCHCTLCQRLTSSAFIHTMHFPDSAFSWTHDTQLRTEVYSVQTKLWKNRHRCTNCGAAVASYNAKENTWSVWGGQLARDENGKIKDWDYLKPTTHIFYGTRMLDIDDQLSKWEGFENESNRIA
ncbi:Mss4-like protein [Mucidula mucida]|nr:Mss4-like protein [Mucidula mucida]